MNDKQKQIEEMAKAMCEEYDTDICKHECPMATDCANILIAKRLIAAGYRKQSDTAREILDEVSQHFGGAWLVELYKKYGMEVEE